MPAKTTSLILALFAICAGLIYAPPAPTASGEAVNPIALRSVEIQSTIENAYAITEIQHTYENTANESAQATFSLSIPEKAFISNFSLTLENQTYYAEILRKGEARDKYNQSVASGKTAGIGESIDTKQFSFSLNIKGNQNATATIRYEHHIPRFMGERSYELYLSSMKVNPENFDLKISIGSVPGITGLMISGYEDQIQEEWEDTHHLVLSMEADNLEISDDLLITYSEDPYSVNGSLVGYFDQLSEEYYFLNVFSPDRTEIGGSFSKDIIFVLDKSGSMSGDKIKQLKDSFARIVDQLPEDDRFNIIMFDNAISVYNTELIYANESNKEDAKNYLQSINAGGSTNLYDGLEKALDMLTFMESRVPIIVMLTDGNANAGRYTHPVPIRQKIQEENTIYCPIFTLGFGYDVDFDFLMALSLENYATAQQIHPGTDAGEQIVDFYKTISTTLLKRIEIDYHGNAYGYFPEGIPALYEGSEAVIVGKLNPGTLGGDFTTTFTAGTPEGTRQFVSSYHVSESDTEEKYVKRFWAYARIYQLMDELTMVSGPERDEIIGEIESISIDAHFATPFTSLYLEIDGEESQDPADEGEEGDDTPVATYGGGSGSYGGAAAPDLNSYKPTPGGSLGVPSDPGPPVDDDSGMSSGDGGMAPGMTGVSTLLAFAVVCIFSFVISKRKR